MTYEITKALVNKTSDFILEWVKDQETGVCATFFSSNGKIIQEAGSNACHAAMGSISVLKSKIIGTSIHGMKDPRFRETNQQFLDWLGSKYSPYNPLFEYLGKNLHWVKNNEGFTVGVFTTTNVVNTRVLQNFFKATRTTKEHVHTLRLWEKYYGKVPKEALGLLWMLGYYYDQAGNRKISTHSSFEGSKDIDLQVFLNPNHNKWDLKTHLASEGNGYRGENTYVFTKGKFNPHESIRPAGERKDIKTLIYSLYHNKSPKSLSDKDFETFFKEALEGYYS